MTKLELLGYIEEQTGSPAEFNQHNETLYIKFDFLPYKLREYIHSHKDYDHSKMILLLRECACGEAYFYEEQHFFGLCNKLKLEQLK